MTRTALSEVYDSSNPQHVKAAEDAQLDRDKDVDFLLAQPRGRRWLYELIWVRCHKDGVSHVLGDSESTAFNEGARSVGSTIEAVLRERSPKQYMKMLEENHFDE